MKSYQDRIAEILAHAPPAPMLHRKSATEEIGMSAETKSKLIMLHAAYATFGHLWDSIH